MDEEDLDDNFQLLLEDNVEIKADNTKSKSSTSGVSSVLGDSVEIVSSINLSEQPSTPEEPMKVVVPLIAPVDDTSPKHDPITRLTLALGRFYEVYNPENINKVAMVASKFSERRHELWEQLSIKYTLSVSASCKLFIELFIDDQASATCYLFNCPPLFIRDDSLATFYF